MGISEHYQDSINQESQRLKGILLAVISSASIGCTYIFSKVALSELNTRSFIPLWMFTGGIYVFLFGLLRGKIKLPQGKWNKIGLLSLGVLEIVSASCFFTAISQAPQPAVVAFLARLNNLFSLLFSVFILREKLGSKSAIGVLLMLIGGFALSYSSGPIGWILLLLTSVMSISVAASLVIGKKVVVYSNPLMMLLTRNMITSIGTALILPGAFSPPPAEIWTVILIGALFGPFLGFLCLYKALDYIDAWMVSIFTITQPLFVSIYDLIIFKNILQPLQVITGILILIGAYIVVRSSVGHSAIIPELDT